MSRLEVQFLDQGLHRVLFDAMPMPVFVVDEDVGLLEYNAAAAQLLGANRHKVLRRRAGDLLHCLHALETPGGCGRSPSCPGCVVRQSVRAAARGRRVTRQLTQLELLDEGKARTVNLRVSCQPITFERHSFVLLILEGLND